ncbi:MAG: helix-hairpin-helix domain-containing protein, partial [Nanoarchaeota archaeon]
MKNLEIVRILNNIADILELQEVQFKPQAYRKAASEIENLTEDIEEIYKKGELEEIPGVGKNIAEKIEEILKTGKLQYYEKLKKEVDVDIEHLNEIPGLGPKKIKVLYWKLGVKTVADLEKACKKHKVQELEGFGVKTEEDFLKGI